MEEAHFTLKLVSFSFLESHIGQLFMKELDSLIELYCSMFSLDHIWNHKSGLGHIL